MLSPRSILPTVLVLNPIAAARSSSGIHAYYEPEELVGKILIAITNLPPRAMMGIESCGMLLSAVNNLKDSEDEELRLLMVDNHIPAGAKLY